MSILLVAVFAAGLGAVTAIFAGILAEVRIRGSQDIEEEAAEMLAHKTHLPELPTPCETRFRQMGLKVLAGAPITEGMPWVRPQRSPVADETGG